MERSSTKAKKHLMLSALKENYGEVRSACREVGICRTTHYEWLKQDKEYRKVSMQFSLKGLAQKRTAIHKRQSANGYVYLIHCVGTSFYKIGISKIDYYARLSTMQSGCPYKLEFVDTMHSTQYQKLEKTLHAKFINKRIRGEWFDLDPESLSEVKAYFEQNSEPQTKIEFEWKR
jgi:hypothetical protein